MFMGDEIIFKNFDGPRNIFFCFIFVVLRGLEHKISKLAIKKIQERQDVKLITSIQQKANGRKKFFDAF